MGRSQYGENRGRGWPILARVRLVVLKREFSGVSTTLLPIVESSVKFNGNGQSSSPRYSDGYGDMFNLRSFVGSIQLMGPGID